MAHLLLPGFAIVTSLVWSKFQENMNYFADEIQFNCNCMFVKGMELWLNSFINWMNSTIFMYYGLTSGKYSLL